ncbi:hypothetical protein ABZ260_42475, partial [Streptosporangium sp. NPDC006013]|uniref:hypothetical protein n=1 Tax=Streptosporangium sp. NPDC006013 TaxID=3155596 RepID=UPI0033AC18B4
MPSVEIILSGLASDRATGSLRLGKAGAIYLTDGRVTYAESAAAPRLEDLLAACRGGRLETHGHPPVRQRGEPRPPPGGGDGEDHDG